LAASEPSLPSSSYGLPARVGFSGLLKASAALYRDNFISLLLIFLPLAVAFLVVVAPLLALPDEQIVLGAGTPTPVLVVVALALTVVPIVVGGIVVAAATVLLTDRIVGRRMGVAATYKVVRRHLAALVAAGLAATVLSVMLREVLPPVAFFIQPLLYGPAVVVQVIALEGSDLRTALMRARDLLRKEALRIFMNLIAISLAVSVLNVLLPTVATIGLGDPNATGSLALGSLVQIVVAILMLPFVASAMVVAYLDLRASKEDLTLDQLATERATAGLA
jgi:hypothetical protein